jgi:hypothetical protein
MNNASFMSDRVVSKPRNQLHCNALPPSPTVRGRAAGKDASFAKKGPIAFSGVNGIMCFDR